MSKKIKRDRESNDITRFDSDELWVKSIKAKSDKQKEYLQAIDDNELVFSTGPAGTGKTFLACLQAAKYLASGKVDRIILCRPAVEAGEKIGFLPGNLEDKLHPYLQPVYDALNHMMGTKQVNVLIQNKAIEVVPLVYMRGRTLNDAFVVLDEAQNTTPKQMKMFLTRMGFGSKFVVNGDITQIDIDTRAGVGLIDAYNRFKVVSGIAWIEFGRDDIVRHPLVQVIVDGYGEEI